MDQTIPTYALSPRPRASARPSLRVLGAGLALALGSALVLRSYLSPSIESGAQPVPVFHREVLREVDRRLDLAVNGAPRPSPARRPSAGDKP